ncbi:hypothetical protein [Streptomyces sp. BBFR102]|uniref:hypothetical protein n=1 Tax=Streptomyces sp. BBFR102 TaxID=3448171 RepID=UPI003F53B13D
MTDHVGLPAGCPVRGGYRLLTFEGDADTGGDLGSRLDSEGGGDTVGRRDRLRADDPGVLAGGVDVAGGE